MTSVVESFDVVFKGVKQWRGSVILGNVDLGALSHHFLAKVWFGALLSFNLDILYALDVVISVIGGRLGQRYVYIS